MDTKQFLLTFLLVIILTLSNSETSFAEYQSISREHAIQIAKQHFENSDYVFSIFDNIEDDMWMFLIDTDPEKGWEHDCFTIDIPKKVEDINYIPLSGPTKRTLPPNYLYQPLYPNKEKIISQTWENWNELNGFDIPINISERSFVVIISGGVEPMTNYIRYWNDCSYIYRVLTQRYGISKSNIYVAMADGTDPAVDTNTGRGGDENYISQNLDLDGDGNEDIRFAATQNDLYKIFNDINNRLEEDDTVFIFVIDHGGNDHPFNGNPEDCYICLWNNERYFPSDINFYLEKYSKKNANLNLLLGQCFSGGFADCLTANGAVIATASNAYESSWAAPGLQFDDFVHHWTNAINKQDFYGNPINPDLNNDGCVSMQEAFEYAYNNDSHSIGHYEPTPGKIEHPQYKSIPESIGEDLAFNRRVYAIDLYIKDDDCDSGILPNTTFKVWNSNSIAINYSDDDNMKHQRINPNNNSQCYLKVKVHNRGKAKYGNKPKYLHAFCTPTRTNLMTSHFINEYGSTANDCNYIGAFVIPQIESCDSTIINIPLELPSEWIITATSDDKDIHNCLSFACCISDSSVLPFLSTCSMIQSAKNQRNVAIKNYSIVVANETGNNIPLIIENNSNTAEFISLDFYCPNHAENCRTTYNKPKLYIDDILYQAWVDGGSRSSGMKLTETNPNSEGYYILSITDINSSLKNIKLPKGISSHCYFYVSVCPPSGTLKFAFPVTITQQDDIYNLMGGNNYLVTWGEKTSTYPPIIIINDTQDDGSTYISAKGENINKYVWYDSNDNLIGNTSDITIPSSSLNQTITLVSIDDEDNIQKTNIEIEKNIGFSKVYFSDSSKNNLNIEFKNILMKEYSITIKSLLSENQEINIPIECGTNQIMVDVTSLESGSFLVILQCEDTIIDSIKITK